MSALTINGLPVAIAAFTRSIYGTWTADVVMPSDAAIASPCTMVIGDMTVSGAVVRQAGFNGDRSARIVGGRGGWRTELPPKGYSHAAGVKLSTIVGDAARECGESIVVASDRTIGSHWARERAKAERVIHFLLDGQWWVDNEGVTQTKDRDASIIAAPFTVINYIGSRGLFEIATESISSWQPGRTFTAPGIVGVQTISSVTIDVGNDGKLRLHVMNTDGATERLRTDLRSIVRSETPSLSYAGVWEYTIASGDDETVDVTPGDDRMPSLTKVPMMPGLMGEIVTPTPGSKCRIVFVNGDPSRPACTGIVGTPMKIEIAGPIPTQAAARFGDSVSGVAITLGSTKVFIGG